MNLLLFSFRATETSFENNLSSHDCQYGIFYRKKHGAKELFVTYN